MIYNSPSMVNRICPDGSGRNYRAVAVDAAIGMVNEFTDETSDAWFGMWYEAAA